MKQLFLAAFAAATLFACSSRHAQKTTMNTSGSETTTTSHTAFMVPSNIQTTFSSQYPNAADVAWTPYDVQLVPIDWDLTDWVVLTPKDYSVTYTMNGVKYYSWYDANGNWVGTTFDVADYNKDLPAAVNQAIASNFTGYSIDKVEQVNWKDRTAYEVKLKNGDLKKKALVDANGNIIKQKDK